MKRLINVFLLFCLFLSGCTMIGERVKEPVTFYYVRENYQKEMDQVILAEVREAAGHRDDLPYLLALYSMGPAKEDAIAPFPRNTRIIPIARSEHSMEISLSDSVHTLSESEFTLAGACIAMTCMELTDVDQVTVICLDRKVTIGKDNLLLYSDMLQNPQEETK